MSLKKTKTIDHKKIAEKIARIPGICEDGKKAIAEILEEFGYKAPTNLDYEWTDTTKLHDIRYNIQVCNPRIASGYFRNLFEVLDTGSRYDGRAIFLSTQDAWEIIKDIKGNQILKLHDWLE